MLLLISDSLSLAALVHRHLACCGWPLRQMHDSRAAMQSAIDGLHAFVLVDAAVNGPGALDVVRHVRRHSQVPVIVVSSFGAGTDVVALLDGGADDVIAGGVDPAEMVARVRAVWRRGERNTLPEMLAAGGVTMTGSSREVHLRGHRVALTAAEYDLLACLVRAAGHIVDRDALVAAVSRRESSPLDRSLDVHVSRLRRKLGRQAPRILTVRGVGYMLAVNDGRTGDAGAMHDPDAVAAPAAGRDGR